MLMVLAFHKRKDAAVGNHIVARPHELTEMDRDDEAGWDDKVYVDRV